MGIWDVPPVDGAQLPARRQPEPEPRDLNPPLDFTVESRFIRLARELAMEMRSTDKILAEYGVGAPEWAQLQRSAWFQKTLGQEMAQWNAANSTHDRVRLKSAVLVEEWLVEANARLRDPDETLSSKVELFKTLARIANLGTGEGEGGGGGFRVVINIAGAPQVTRTINVPQREVSDVEDVAVQREHDIRKESERHTPSVAIPGTRVAVREPEVSGITVRDVGTERGISVRVPERPPERPPRELQAAALRSPARKF